jgi:hypothetical protein
MVQNRKFFAYSFIFGILIACISHIAKADILFEGYSKVLSGGVHIGYSIVRYEFDNKKKQFIATTFLKTNEFGGNLTESLKAYSTDDMKPLSYQYTTLVGKDVKTIDAKVEKNKLLASVKMGNKTEKISKDLPKGSFFSSFLAYVMLRSPTGFKAETKYDFQAVAEEDGTLNPGIAMIKNQESLNGIQAYKVLNEFKGSKFISMVSDKGEVFSTKSPVQGISTELVAKPSDATNGFTLPAATLRTLFGNIPTGQMNEVSKFAQKQPPAAATPAPSAKQNGVPAGQGIQVKATNTEGQ